MSEHAAVRRTGLFFWVVGGFGSALVTRVVLFDVEGDARSMCGCCVWLDSDPLWLYAGCIQAVPAATWDAFNLHCILVVNALV